MFGKFGGIVIIALSGAIIAGLILRPTPDLPPAMSLGVPDASANSASTPEPTVDNQDKQPAVVEAVTDTADSAEEKPATTDKVEEKSTETVTEKLTDMTADKAKAAAEKVKTEASEVVEKVKTEASEAVEKVMTQDSAKEGTEKSE